VVLRSLLLVIEMTTFLDCIKYRSNVHKESFAGPVFVPHLKVERRILLNCSLDLKVSQLHNFILNFVLCRYVGERWQLTKFDSLALAGLKSLWDKL
jgi:hypothetical protein